MNYLLTAGKTAMEFALQFPERVEKLVVADMAPRRLANRRFLIRGERQCRG
jgi:pimeloyl-ACP methyl ester carboxylesterase